MGSTIELTLKVWELLKIAPQSLKIIKLSDKIMINFFIKLQVYLLIFKFKI